MPDPSGPESTALSRLADADLQPAGFTDDDLVAAAVEAQAIRVAVGSAAAGELHRRGWSWRRIGDAFGIDHTTPYRWVRGRTTSDRSENRAAVDR